MKILSWINQLGRHPGANRGPAYWVPAFAGTTARVSLLVLVVSLVGGVAQASNPFDQISSHADARFLNPFAQDLGAVLGGGSFHNGQALGFPGVDVGIHTPLKHVDGKDDIANAAGISYLAIPWIQA